MIDATRLKKAATEVGVQLSDALEHVARGAIPVVLPASVLSRADAVVSRWLMDTGSREDPTLSRMLQELDGLRRDLHGADSPNGQRSLKETIAAFSKASEALKSELGVRDADFAPNTDRVRSRWFRVDAWEDTELLKRADDSPFTAVAREISAVLESGQPYPIVVKNSAGKELARETMVQRVWTTCIIPVQLDDIYVLDRDADRMPRPAIVLAAGVRGERAKKATEATVKKYMAWVRRGWSLFEKDPSKYTLRTGKPDFRLLAETLRIDRCTPKYIADVLRQYWDLV